MMTEPTKPTNPFAAIGAAIGGVGGWALGRYCGAGLWLPGGAAILLWALFAKTRLGPQHFAGAIAVTGGHIAWFVIGSFVAGAWTATVLVSTKRKRLACFSASARSR